LNPDSDAETIFSDVLSSCVRVVVAESQLAAASSSRIVRNGFGVGRVYWYVMTAALWAIDEMATAGIHSHELRYARVRATGFQFDIAKLQSRCPNSLRKGDLSWP